MYYMPALILYAYNPVTLNNYITCFLLGGRRNSPTQVVPPCFGNTTVPPTISGNEWDIDI